MIKRLDFTTRAERGAFYITVDGCFSDDPGFSRPETVLVFYRHPERIVGRNGYWCTDDEGQAILSRFMAGCWSMTNRGLLRSVSLQPGGSIAPLRCRNHRNWQMGMAGPDPELVRQGQEASAYFQTLSDQRRAREDVESPVRPAILDAFLSAEWAEYLTRMDWIRKHCDYLSLGLARIGAMSGLFLILNGRIDFVAERLIPACRRAGCHAHLVSKSELPQDWVSI